MSMSLLQILLFTGAAAASDPGGPEAIDPGSWVTSRDYPFEAVREGAEGTVGFEIQVDADGKPSGCVVTEPSGSDSLDSVTCAILRREAQFRPARNAGGKAIPSFYRSRVAWRLPEPVPEEQLEDHVAVVLDLPADRTAPRCRVEPENITRLEKDMQCAMARGELGPETARSFKRIAVLTTFSAPGGAAPYAAKPEWGTRLARRISDLTLLKGGTHAVRCISIATEGPIGPDACGGFRDSRRLSEAELAAARTVRVEMTLYGVPRD